MSLITAVALIGTPIAVALTAKSVRRKRLSQCVAPELEDLGLQAFCSKGNGRRATGVFIPSGYDPNKFPGYTILVFGDGTTKGLAEAVRRLEWESQAPFKRADGTTHPPRNAVLLWPLRGSRDPKEWMLTPDNVMELLDDAVVFGVANDNLILTGLGDLGELAAKNVLKSGLVPDAVQYLKLTESGEV